VARFSSVIVPLRSRIAALIAKHSPDRYKRIIENRHPGVLVVGDPMSDVRSLKERAAEQLLHSLEQVGLPVLAKIDDRNCWIVLAGTGDDEDDVERLVGELIDAGMRISVAMRGRRTKRISSRERLQRLKQNKPLDILSIRAGFVWMRNRGYKQVGWHAAVRVHFYDWNTEHKSFVARRAGNLPPMIDDLGQEKSRITGLCRPETRLDKVRFPIDVVYTWVDGNDPRWNEKRNRRAAEMGRDLHRVSNSQTRYINRDELRYSLRSLYYYAPWIRKIYLVTDDQVPDWLNADNDLLQVIDHKDLFPEHASLPTFNSHAIESVLHRIPGLSEQFLYMNDDVFFSSVVHPESFFEVSGIARTFLSRSMIPFCNENRSEIASEWGAMNANDLIVEKFGAMMPYKTKHTPLALRRSLLQDLEDQFRVHFERLRSTPFRTANDLAPTSTLHAYFGLAKGYVVRSDIAYRYVNLARPDLKRALDAIAYSRHSMVYCLNDTEIEDHAEFDWDAQEFHIKTFLNMMYPYQAPWEQPEPDDSPLETSRTDAR